MHGSQEVGKKMVHRRSMDFNIDQWIADRP